MRSRQGHGRARWSPPQPPQPIVSAAEDLTGHRPLMRRFKPIGHHDRLSVVDHLDELRFRLIVSVTTFAVALGLSFWQNHLLLRIVDAPLAGKRPVTFGVSEPFTATLTVADYAAIVLTLPILLSQLYAYLL